MWEPTAEIQEAATAPSRAIGCGGDQRKSANLRWGGGGAEEAAQTSGTARKKGDENWEATRDPGGQRDGGTATNTNTRQRNTARRQKRKKGRSEAAFISKAGPEEELGATRHKRARKEAPLPRGAPKERVRTSSPPHPPGANSSSRGDFCACASAGHRGAGSPKGSKRFRGIGELVLAPPSASVAVSSPSSRRWQSQGGRRGDIQFSTRGAYRFPVRRCK